MSQIRDIISDCENRADVSKAEIRNLKAMDILVNAIHELTEAVKSISPKSKRF